MPTKREREYYAMGFRDGVSQGRDIDKDVVLYPPYPPQLKTGQRTGRPYFDPVKPKRKLSAWQKFVKANSKKPRFRYKSGAKKGRVNLKALGVAYRKKRR